jgi:hypothetical protein
MNECDPDRAINQHANKFTMVNTRNVDPGSKPYVLPSQCEHVFYLEVPGRGGWSYVIIYDPRGSPIKYNVVEEDDIEEEDDVEEQLVHVSDKYVVEVEGDVLDNFLDEDDIDNVLDEELEKVEPNVGDNVPDDDIDDDMIGNDDIDDDANIANPYNIIFKADDTNVELDER